MLNSAPADFDIIVVGGGHAGCEAALAAARLGAKVCLATLREDTIAALSCNPAIGGVGKGQLVRELDALGGEMGKITDKSAIQYRMLNTSKGEAVHSLRAQVDKQLYSQEMRKVIAQQSGLTVLEASVEGLHLVDSKLAGIVLQDGSVVSSSKVILTNGTFLRGLMHTGKEQSHGGRVGENAVMGMSACLEDLGFESGRLKTGTPPRLNADSIDFSQIEKQLGDPHPEGFSHFNELAPREWMHCYITRTTEESHDVIRENIQHSPMFQGVIEGIGPRYCPSIEDKVVRFPERTGHIVHLEPEGLNTNSIYVNGVSTSLPAEVQDHIIRHIPGLEKAEFLKYGYAVEYDFFPPHQIQQTFESRLLAGLYLAGQICGTSGYEEAASQGFLAGVNAAKALRNEEPWILGRDEAYMGVLADDLVRLDPREPYRMFTSRAEYRLLLRHDNADFRLSEKGEALGLITTEEADQVRDRAKQVDELLDFVSQTKVGPKKLIAELRQPKAKFDDLYTLLPELEHEPWAPSVRKQVLIRARYESYIQRQQVQVERQLRYEHWLIPDDMDIENLKGLRSEAKEKIIRFLPRTIGQAGRIAGVTPADVSLLMVALKAREPNIESS